MLWRNSEARQQTKAPASPILLAVSNIPQLSSDYNSPTSRHHRLHSTQPASVQSPSTSINDAWPFLPMLVVGRSPFDNARPRHQTTAESEKGTLTDLFKQVKARYLTEAGLSRSDSGHIAINGFLRYGRMTRERRGRRNVRKTSFASVSGS